MTDQLLVWVTILIWISIGLLLIIGINEIIKLRPAAKAQPAPDAQIATPRAWVLSPKSFGRPADASIRSQFVFEKVRQKHHEELVEIIMMQHRYMATQDHLPTKQKFTRQRTTIMSGPALGKRYGENQALESA
jgi:hypothetical protein